MPPPREREPHQPDWRLILARYAQAWQRSRQTPNRHNLNVLTAGEQMRMRPDPRLRELRRPRPVAECGRSPTAAAETVFTAYLGRSAPPPTAAPT